MTPSKVQPLTDWSQAWNAQEGQACHKLHFLNEPPGCVGRPSGGVTRLFPLASCGPMPSSHRKGSESVCTFMLKSTLRLCPELCLPACRCCSALSSGEVLLYPPLQWMPFLPLTLLQPLHHPTKAHGVTCSQAHSCYRTTSKLYVPSAVFRGWQRSARTEAVS